MFIACAVIQLHACLPHEHAEVDCAPSYSNASEGFIGFWDNLWHPDMGEDHLEVFEVPANVPTFLAASTSEWQFEDALILSLQAAIIPWEFALPPPKHRTFSQLRAPPFFT